MGSISDRIGCRPVLLFGLGTTAVLINIVNYVSSFCGPAYIFFGLGITTGAIWIVCPVLAAEPIDIEYRGAAIGTYRTFFDLGSILGPMIMTAVMESIGISLCFYIASALLLANMAPTVRLLKRQ